MKKLFEFLNTSRIEYRNVFLQLSIIIAFISVCFYSFADMSINNSLIYNNVCTFLGDLVFIISTAIMLKCNNLLKLFTILYFILLDCIFYAITGMHFSIVFTFCLCIFIRFITLKLTKNRLFVFYIILGLVVYIFSAYLYPILLYYLKEASPYLIKYPSLFVPLNNIYTLFISNSLDNILNTTSVGLVRIINEQIIIGVKSYFIESSFGKDDIISNYLSSNYILNIFVSLGMFLNLYAKVDKKSKFAFLLLTISAVMSGYNVLLMLFILLLNPFYYCGYILLSFMANVVVKSLNISLGYVFGAGVFEIIDNIHKPVYFFIIGIIFLFLSYYVFEILSKNTKSVNIMVLDNNAKRIISSLGGLNNIEKVNGNELIVKNPNLINILKLDCEIYNNRVVLLEDDSLVLKEYL